MRTLASTKLDSGILVGCRMYSDYRYFFGTGNPLRGFEKAMKKPRCHGPTGTLRGESSEIEAITGPGINIRLC